MTTWQRGRVWAAVRDAVQAGERLGTFGPALPYEQVSARLDAIARDAADRIEAVLGDGGAVVSDSDRGPATADGEPWKGV